MGTSVEGTKSLYILHLIRPDTINTCMPHFLRPDSPVSATLLPSPDCVTTQTDQLLEWVLLAVKRLLDIFTWDENDSQSAGLVWPTQFRVHYTFRAELQLIMKVKASGWLIFSGQILIFLTDEKSLLCLKEKLICKPKKIISEKNCLYVINMFPYCLHSSHSAFTL